MKNIYSLSIVFEVHMVKLRDKKTQINHSKLHLSVLTYVYSTQWIYKFSKKKKKTRNLGLKNYYWIIICIKNILITIIIRLIK